MAWGTHVRTVPETMWWVPTLWLVTQLPIDLFYSAGSGEPQRLQSLLLSSEGGSVCSSLQSVVPVAAQGAAILYPVLVSGKPFCMVQGSAGHSWARQPLSSSV